ncbi:hypothetical protein [Oceaniglobus roseus]|uniref:hypothetical protein n=1 Tax=Oceaniglobus roseus TaxID=1737570 RepID=UPI000C7E89BE|nr:hypothetical protein [Kandeliimicrobium roseum]
MIRRTLTAAVTGTALLMLPVGAALDALQMDPVHPATLDAPDLDTIGLRAMAEIDGDPATFTADERRKMVVLGQVLGTAPLGTMEAFNLIES